MANVQDSAQSIRTAGYLNGIPSVTVIIFRQPGANIIQTNNRIRAQLPFLAAVMPQGIKTTIVLDRTTTIKASLHDVESSLIISVVLVILVVFLFLRNGRATLIPSVAVPVSLIGTFAVMYLLGYSLDNLSLMALTISTGFVVDDAIVVMENISRYLEMGMAPTEAALKGAKEIGFTVLTMSTSLIAVFIPLLMMGGIVGRLFREFAVTLSTAIIVSMMISLDHHADDVRPLAQGARGREAWRDLSRQREVLRRDAERLPAFVAVGAGQFGSDAGGVVADHRAERGADHQDTQGLFPAAGHGGPGGRGTGTAGRIVPGDERFDQSTGQCD